MKIKLEKLYKPDFDELYRMISELKNFLKEKADMDNDEWKENLDIMLEFQDYDGSFKLMETFDIPSDARVDFCYMPTYICTAILMKAFLTTSFDDDYSLAKALESSCGRNLKGHGYDSFKDQMEALKIFAEGGLREFTDLHGDICPKFTRMIEEISSDFALKEENNDFKGLWGESYEEDIRFINEYFSHRNVFVYGTLMKDEVNHHYLEGCDFISCGAIEGYEMHKMGWYPAIVEGGNVITGEIYHVFKDDVSSMDILEGEGRLYERRCAMAACEEGLILSYVYVYMGDISNNEIISSWNRDYVWYVSYGSNMLYERFMTYIEGGSYKGSREHPPCDDASSPLIVRRVEIPYGMYFGNYSSSWNCGVSFLDTSNKGKAYGVAYLITKEQIEHVCRRENAGSKPEDNPNWYNEIIDLGEMDGFRIKTLTNSTIRDYYEPSEDYLNTLRDGLEENYPEMSDKEIEDYLNGCIRCF